MGSSNKIIKRFVEISLYLGCLLSNISQLPFFVRSGFTQVLSFPGWILLMIAVCLAGKLKISKFTKKQILLCFILSVWLLLDSIIILKNQAKSSMFYSYLISLFIYLLGSWASEHVDNRVINNINGIFVVSIVFVTANIFFEYFGFGYNLSTYRYAYGSKNSVSQIIFTAIIILILYKPRHIIGRLIRVFAIAFELYVTLFLRSRATLVSLLLCICVLVVSRETDKKVKIAITFASIVTILLLINNQRFNYFIFNNVIFAGRNASNLNEVTSGRIDILASFPELIYGNWITGIGPVYYECFPLSAILQFGLIGGFLVIYISLQPLFKSYLYRSTSSNWFLLFLIAVGYSINGLFEGLTPFGPGVKCYYMWLLLGVLINKPTKNIMID